MLRRKTIYRDMADVNIYTAKRLGDMALSLGELAKSCEEESGKDRTLTKEDGLAAVNAAALRDLQGLHTERQLFSVLSDPLF